MGEFILVIGNGNWPSKALIQTLIEKSDTIIALDGAADKFDSWDIVIGDMDSINNQEQYEADTSQCDSDLAKALRRYDVNAVVGIEGGRLDHQLAAFTSLFETNSNAIVYSDSWRACRVPIEGLELNLDIGTRCSIMPFGTVKGVNLNGCEYELSNQDIKTGTLGVGNKINSNPVNISHESGDLLFIWEANVA